MEMEVLLGFLKHIKWFLKHSYSLCMCFRDCFPLFHTNKVSSIWKWMFYCDFQSI